jgi:hypothetical protein
MLVLEPKTTTHIDDQINIEVDANMFVYDDPFKQDRSSNLNLAKLLVEKVLSIKFKNIVLNEEEFKSRFEEYKEHSFHIEIKTTESKKDDKMPEVSTMLINPQCSKIIEQKTFGTFLPKNNEIIRWFLEKFKSLSGDAREIKAQCENIELSCEADSDGNYTFSEFYIWKTEEFDKDKIYDNTFVEQCLKNAAKQVF